MKKEKKKFDPLFDNPYVKQAMDSMTPEQLRNYKVVGESMYNDVDFVSGTINTGQIKDASVYIAESIKSGEHISFLDENEKEIMKQVYGEEWYLKFGYVKEDVDAVYTVL